MLHGQARSLEKNFINNKNNFLNKYDVDTFCQVVWDEKIEKNKFYTGRRGVFEIEENTIEKVIEYYNPKKILISKDYAYDDNFEESIFSICPAFLNYKKKYETDSLFTLLQFKGIYEASNLFDWNEYDFIVKLRYDTSIINFPNLELLDKSKFYAYSNIWGTFYNQNDFFCDYGYIMGNSFYEYMQMYKFLQKDDITVYPFVAEYIYNHYLIKMNLTTKLVKLNKDEFNIFSV